VDANAFLKANPKIYEERMTEADVQTTLLAEVEAGIGTSTGSKAAQFEELLKSMFNALPKNEHGGLGHSTVRYALHRFFVQRHGWVIQGLDRAGESWNGTSPAGMLKDQVPAYVQELFEKRLDGKGLGLHELAVMAATIEHLVHNEALAKLGNAFDIHAQLPSSQLNATQANEILETYMMSYILGSAMTKKSLKVVNKLKAKMSQIYLPWPDTQVFIRESLAKVTQGAQLLDFAMVARVAENMGENFGSFQASECNQLKSTLLKVEDRGTGRVRLHDFYKPAFGGQDGAWQFQESAPYLRQIGALDESIPGDVKVIVANYLGSQANCIASSSFYTVCCIDECESLLTHLESNIMTSEAPPDRVAGLVSSLASSTVAAPRELSATLRRRLDEIAGTHGGTIPLHGRLFAQWMHHAYPRECPFPHMSGTTAPMGALDWQAESGQDHTATKDEIERIVQEFQSKSTSDMMDSEEEASELMPWSHEEELLVVRPIQLSTGSSSPALGCLRSVSLFAALASIAMGLVRSFKKSPGFGEDSLQKFYV